MSYGIVIYFLLVSLVLAPACSSEEQVADTRYIVTDNDAGAVSIIFAEPRANGQYCIYRKDFAIGVEAPVGLLDLKASGDAQLLTERSVAADDLRRAVSSESVHTSYAFSAGTYALFPTATVCLAMFMAWAASHNATIGRAALLSCSASVALIGAAMNVSAEGRKKDTAAVNAVLSTEMYRADETLPRIQKVLTWLTTENSLPCRSRDVP